MMRVESPQPQTPDSPDLNILALCKGVEKFVFVFYDRRRAELLRTFGRFAANAELSFTWHDAAVLSKRVRDNTPDQVIT